jgi:hypothetical protein
VSQGSATPVTGPGRSAAVTRCSALAVDPTDAATWVAAHVPCQPPFVGPGATRSGHSGRVAPRANPCDAYAVIGKLQCPLCGASEWKCSWMPWTKKMRCRSCGAKVKSPWA